MDWLNLHIPKLGAPDFRVADERMRGVWLSLLLYCASQENSGIIDNCANWTERQWQQICGVSRKYVHTESTLWEWLDGSLIVKLYPIEKQKEVQRLRSQAKAGADAKWDAFRHARGNAHASASRHADGNAEGEGEGEVEKEGEGEGALSPKASLSGGEAARQRYRALLEKHSCTLALGDKDIFGEWLKALGKKPVSWAGFLFEQKRITPALPSHFRADLKRYEGEFEYWNATRTKQTERISKESA